MSDLFNPGLNFAFDPGTSLVPTGAPITIASQGTVREALSQKHLEPGPMSPETILLNNTPRDMILIFLSSINLMVIWLDVLSSKPLGPQELMHLAGGSTFVPPSACPPTCVTH